MQTGQKLLLLMAGLFLAGACSGSHEPVQEHPRSSSIAPPTEAVLVDVPSLVTLSIDQLDQRLGPRRPLPPGFTDPILAPLLLRQVQLDSVSFFKHQGLSVVANYDHNTRQVSDLLLLGTDAKSLMRRTNLVPNAPGYLVLPVFEARRPTQLLGLRVLATSPELP